MSGTRGTLLTDLAASAEAKAVESLRLRTKTLAASQDQLDRAAEAMAARFDAGGRLFTFGNGGSATDAATVAALFASPPDGTALPALSLAGDEAVLTALGNDVGFDLVFSRQLIAHAQPGRHGARAVHQRQLERTCSWPSRRPPAGGCSPSAWPATTAARWPRAASRPLPRGAVGQRPPDPGDAGRPGLRAVAAGAVGLPSGRNAVTDTRPNRLSRDSRGNGSDAESREAAVLERIERFRRRRLPAHRRGRHPGPRRRWQGVGGADRRGVPARLRRAGRGGAAVNARSTTRP